MKAVATVMLILAGLPTPLAAWEAAPSPRNTAAHTTGAICRRLTDAAEQTEALLLGVTDKASADAAAPRLQAQFKEVSRLLGWLEEAPTDEQSGREISQTLMAITLIAQRYMPVIVGLQEQNAYGSTELMAVLDAQNAGETPTAEPAVAEAVLPHVLLYEDMALMAGNTLYELRKTTDVHTARATATALRQALRSQQQLLGRLRALPPPPPGTDRKLRAAREHLTRLRDEMADEATRLRKVAFYQDPDLAALLTEYMNALL
ncbi:MAG: hypothetical protein Q4F38_04120 [Akkermansia sp.]|nr:hypothetical protein [Akkermansia sp.]